LKTCLALPNCAPLSGSITCPLMAVERPSQPEALGAAAARADDPKTVPVANAPAAARKKVCREISRVGSRGTVMSAFWATWRQQPSCRRTCRRTFSSPLPNGSRFDMWYAQWA
jgi:hypothetical protein